MKTLDDYLCVHKEIAIKQREKELMQGLGLRGTMGYELTGCYECNGYKFKCSKYTSNKSIEELRKEAVE